MELTSINLTNIDPEVVFKPERRNLEYQFLQDQREEIDSLDIPNEEKSFMKKQLWSYYLEFDKQFTEYHRIMREHDMWIALAGINKKRGQSELN
jgi:hypothetical protein